MLFPFVRQLFRPRNVTSSPQAWYKPVSTHSDSNLVNAYESTIGPPNWSYTSLPQGGGPRGAAFIPQFEVSSNPTPGLLQTANYIGGGQLYTSSDSVPDQEIF